VSSNPRAYYNEFDLKAAAWLRELIKEGHIAPGDVDTRSITDVRSADLNGYTQCHFFAGIGGWSYALRIAQWPDSRPVWTGSCPCQPFSAAGKRGGTDDARHLWPEFYRLIRECRPATVFGEQVASKDGLAWLDIVSADLERADYAIGAADLCAASVGAPHIRQRLYFVADAGQERQQQHPERDGESDARRESSCGDDVSRCGIVGNTDNAGPQGRREHRDSTDERITWPPILGGIVEHATSDGRQQWRPEPGGWSTPGGCEYLPCTDGKARPVEPGTFPLAHGAASRVGRLRAYGNAVDAEATTDFCRNVGEVLGLI
jgi:DNA (cytosine-5)-methyltransferase 1